MRWTRNIRAAALVAVAGLGLAACGGGSDQPAAQSKGGAPIVVASFNFTDSQILAEIYAGALEAKGYPVTRKLNLGSRELIYPSLKKDELQFVPEYQGAAIATGFGKDAVKDIPDLKRFPVENVSWDQCQLFVAKLNQREKESGWVYRLPMMAAAKMVRMARMKIEMKASSILLNEVKRPTFWKNTVIDPTLVSPSRFL